MDVVLDFCDEKFFTPYVYPAGWAEDGVLRQFISLNIVTNLGGIILYIVSATLFYFFIFDKQLLKHPQILENQILKEIECTMKSLPLMGSLTSICFLAEVRGHSKLYSNISDSPHGWWMIGASIISFILFTDCFIYWIHRGLHHRLIYKDIHKLHHKWKVPTPFASHAFHPIDGFTQSLPYHIYVFLFPMHKFTYLLLYIFVNVWTVSIHDGDFRVPKLLQPIINGCAHHTDHHLFYNYNFGQYLTVWDRLGGSFKFPSSYEGTGPLDQIKEAEGKTKKLQ